jgi:hydroxymethylpyrimidine/phosphomethylpyrimidine kinase
VADLFVNSQGQKWWLRAPRIHSPNTHGTGCTLSSAIAAHLALGDPIEQAIEKSHAYIRQALQAGAHVRTGSGSGPLNHISAPVPMHTLQTR